MSSVTVESSENSTSGEVRIAVTIAEVKLFPEGGDPVEAGPLTLSLTVAQARKVLQRLQVLLK